MQEINTVNEEELNAGDLNEEELNEGVGGELEEIVLREQKKRLLKEKKKRRRIIIISSVSVFLLLLAVIALLFYKYSIVDQRIHKGFWAIFDLTEGDNELDPDLDEFAFLGIFDFLTGYGNRDWVDEGAQQYVWEYFGVESEQQLDTLLAGNCYSGMHSDYVFWLDENNLGNRFLEEVTASKHYVKEAYIMHTIFNDKPIAFMFYYEFRWRILPLKAEDAAALEKQTMELRKQREDKKKK